MKTIVIVILAGLIAVPLWSWAKYGNMGEILPWFGLIGILGLAVIIISKIKGTKLF